MTLLERLDAMLEAAEPGSVLVLSNDDWFALRAERQPGVDDHGSRGLMFRGCRVYVSGETRIMGPAEAAQWGIVP